MQKPEGSLAKWPGRSGTFRYRPLDRDLRDQVCCALDLIRAVASRSGGQEGFGRAGRRRWSPESSSAAALRRRWPISAFPGSIRPGLGSVGIYAACASLWRQKRGSARLGRGSPRRGADCAAAHRRRARAGVAGCATGYTNRSRRLSERRRSSPRLESSVGVVQGARRRIPAASRGGAR